MNSGNLYIWDNVCKTDPDYTRPVSRGGRTFTSIDAQHQIYSATELFGPYGKAWGFKDIDINLDLIDKNLVVFKGIFFYPEGEFPIFNSMKIYMDKKNSYLDEEFAKKIETDSITKALSRLGFNADVFLGKFDDSRYIQTLYDEKKVAEKEKNIENDILEINNSQTEEDLISVYKKLVFGIDKNSKYVTTITEIASNRKKEIVNE